MRQIINTPAAPAAIGPYSQAVKTGDFVYTSGQIGLDPVTGQLVEGIEAQTRQVMSNLAAVLGAAGASFSDVVKTTIFLTSMDDFQAVNLLYAAQFPSDPPARSTVQVAGLPRKALVEIEVVAQLAGS